MKVSECKRCIHSQRKSWSTSYKPNNYHYIGVSHVYLYCKLLQKRCLDVKKKECKEKINEKED